jgi:S1-C subfamily serine protease
MLRPPSRFEQWRTRRTLAPRGFVPMSPGREKIRHRILPRTVIGTSAMLLAFAVGVGFSGAAFYAYYDNRLAENERQITSFVDGFDRQFTDATGALDDLRTQSIDDVRAELGPLADFASDARGVIDLPQTAGPSVWTVETVDDQGRPVTGSAFAVTGVNGGSALITSLSVVRAATVDPAPAITLVKGDQRVDAGLWSWDGEHDLALLTTIQPIEPLPLADPMTQAGALGGRVFAMSGLGGQGATASPGVLVDRSSSGLQHTAPVGTFFVGGPIVDGQGRVLGMASLAYAPLGIEPGVVGQSPDVVAICSRLLVCDDTTAGRLPLVGDPQG